MFDEYDIIVVGGGHAGCEASCVSSNLGMRTLLITMSISTIAQMSCNPAVGGVAKGQIVREIDALGGYTGVVTDKSMIQFRMLNLSKGPAMWSPRAQCDKDVFSKEWRKQLEAMPNLEFWQDSVMELIVDNGEVKGVKTKLGHSIYSKSVVLTNGTFLNGKIHIGAQSFGGGRSGEPSSEGLTACLGRLGFVSGRMKTGTPPRVDSRSLDYSMMEPQPGDENPVGFSYLYEHKLIDQLPCHVTYTNPEVHKVLEEGFADSPMFAGRIQGIGPRYCPSIEDKINRFSDKDRHQIFVEPEGRDTVEVYVNGFSTSLPQEIQYKALKLIPGFENVRIIKPGYAIEYDFFQPTQLKKTLETKLIDGLYFAGQINGTTGYEEAACQGLWAGINAARKILGKASFILSRSEAYMGVLIDDLVNKGTDEPYRMFTSRAEFRILLRQDNADIRLTEISHKIGLASKDRLDKAYAKIKDTENIISFFKKESIAPDDVNLILEEKKTAPIKQKLKLINIISRPQIALNDLRVIHSINEFCSQFQRSSLEQAVIRLKYDGYIEKERELVDKMNRLENIVIGDDFDFHVLKSVSTEAKEKLFSIRPHTLGQASRISGISPADISALLIYLGR